MVKHAYFQTHAPPAPLLAAVARKAAALLLGYARAKSAGTAKARRGVKLPVREFGSVILDGQQFGAVYEDGRLIAVIPDVERL